MTGMTSPGRTGILLFDLGGVLLETRCLKETFGLQIDADTFMRKWIQSPAVRGYERGETDEKTFAQGIVAEAALPYDWREFLARFDSWPERLYPGILTLIDSIPSCYRRVLLSNTNPRHWHKQGIAENLESRFDETFLSYLTGHVKPDREAFAQVTDAFGCEANQVIFFDDNPANIAAGKDFGCQSVLTRGIDELRSSFEQLGIDC